MKNPNRSSIVLAMIAGAVITAAAVMMGQGATQRGPADTQ